MCCQNFLKKLFTFFIAFLVGIFVVEIYQVNYSNNKTQDLSSNENLVIAKKQTQSLVKENGIETKNKDRGASGLSDRRSDCLNYCRVCKCESEPSNNSPKVTKTENSANSKPLNIIYKPHAKYTKEAKLNNIQGNVRLRIVFLANGEIGSINEIAGLPFGLTEKAIEAAQKIRFEPQITNGRAVVVSKVVVFRFEIY